jgi:hypothetical protein
LRKLKRKKKLVEKPPKYAKRSRADGTVEPEEELVKEPLIAPQVIKEDN